MIGKVVESWLAADDDRLPGYTADVVIGIGIDVSPDGKNASPYSAAVAAKAVELYAAGYASNVLFTGGYCTSGGVTEAAAMRSLSELRIPPVHLFTEAVSFRTFMNADCTLPILQRHGWKSAIIVTQQWHARRVRATFRKRWAGTGIKIYVVKAWSGYGGGSQSRLNRFWTFAAWDTLAFIIGKLKGHC